jgi:hypothetical protein
VLRNRLARGGATCNSKTRAQLRDGTHMLAAIVPVLVGLMLENQQAEFGETVCTVV